MNIIIINLLSCFLLQAPPTHILYAATLAKSCIDNKSFIVDNHPSKFPFITLLLQKLRDIADSTIKSNLNYVMRDKTTSTVVETVPPPRNNSGKPRATEQLQKQQRNAAAAAVGMLEDDKRNNMRHLTVYQSTTQKQNTGMAAAAEPPIGTQASQVSTKSEVTNRDVKALQNEADINQVNEIFDKLTDCKDADDFLLYEDEVIGLKPTQKAMLKELIKKNGNILPNVLPSVLPLLKESTET